MQDVIEHFDDDVEGSFLGMCVRAPENSLRRGISAYDLTMFNTPQLERLVVELGELPEDEKTPVVKRVIEAADQTIRRAGYMLFIGD
ncbi:hypothetical protein NJL88_29535 [Streptomyces sp. DK15]|uniref:hypothetical protein n=1 Tax=Streptomyces sp. DK15 TaxID=2957499 RepID=UPI0029ACA15E|nr:hypothetical protein [Streptomyces sp. DK15]MDX2394129.1 hypothetical protein [Streptomyces sp. DK15]